MIEDKLENLRRDYQRINPPLYLVQNGWANLIRKLESPDVRQPTFMFMFSYRFVFAVLAIFATGAVLTLSQISGPGDALYPVKIASDKIISQITGNYEANIEKRAQEVINSSTDPKDNIDEATRQYQKALEEAKEKEKDSGRYQQTLEQQEERFRDAQRQNPQPNRGLEEAIQHTQEAKGEVQGQKDEHQPQNNQNQENNQGQQKGKNK